MNIGIEYDGIAWHNKEKDEKKNKICIDRGIKLIRIREKGLVKLQTPCKSYSLIPNDKIDLELTIIGILLLDLGVHVNMTDIDISRDYIIIQARYRTIKKEKSLSVLYPNIAREWCVDKNGGLKPDQVTVGSGVQVWWRCEECGFEWKTDVYHRAQKGTGCPKCKKASAHEKYMEQILSKTLSLQEAYPEIAAEWNAEKNVGRSPDAVAAKSSQKFWWKCNVCGNEWQSTVVNRTNLDAGCPKCARLRSMNQKSCRKVMCIETQEVYYSIAEVERRTGIHHSSVIACCKGKRNTAGGYHWRYEEDDK